MTRRATAPYRLPHATRRDPAIPRSSRAEAIELVAGIVVSLALSVVVLLLLLNWPL